MYDNESGLAALRDQAIQITQNHDLINEEEKLTAELTEFRKILYAELYKVPIHHLTNKLEYEFSAEIGKLYSFYLALSLGRSKEVTNKLLSAAKVYSEFLRINSKAAQLDYNSYREIISENKEHTDKVYNFINKTISGHQESLYHKYIKWLDNAPRRYKWKKRFRQLLYSIVYLTIFLLIFAILGDLAANIIEPTAAHIVVVALMWLVQEYFVSPRIHERLNKWKFSNLMHMFNYLYQEKKKMLYLKVLLEHEFRNDPLDPSLRDLLKI